MLAQDMLTGRIHEVPDHIGGPVDGWPDPQLYGLGEVHDGYGNSLGLFFLPKLIKGAIGAVKRVVGGGGAPAPSAAAATCPPCPPCSPQRQMMPFGPSTMPPGYPFPGRPRRRRRR